MKRIIAAAGFGLLLNGAGHAAPDDQMLVKEMQSWTASMFRIDPAQALDDELRKAGQVVADAHLKRMAERELPAWIADERTRGAPLKWSNEMSQRLWLRIINEAALSRVEPTEPATDRLWLAAYRQPRLCHGPDNGSYFAIFLHMVNGMPPAQQQLILAQERERLARWGSVRKDLPARPLVSVDQEVVRMIGQIRAGGARPALALSPMLAHTQLSRAEGGMDPEQWIQRCARAQWWLLQQPDLDTDAGLSRALTAFRYATIFMATDWGSQRKPAAGDDEAYPPAASQFGLEGLLRLRLQIDADGKPRAAEILSRKLTAPGIRDNPPLVLETLLDEHTIAKARRASFAKPDPATLRNGVFTAEQEFLFQLDKGQTEKKQQ